jgi:hypothetical protein
MSFRHGMMHLGYRVAAVFGVGLISLSTATADSKVALGDPSLTAGLPG